MLPFHSIGFRAGRSSHWKERKMTSDETQGRFADFNQTAMAEPPHKHDPKRKDDEEKQGYDAPASEPDAKASAPAAEPDSCDRVGYRRPPRHSRFQAGRSGNPRGRPPGSSRSPTSSVRSSHRR